MKDLLAGASRNDAAMHERFWAEDLIYTGSSGRRQRWLKAGVFEAIIDGLRALLRLAQS